jgi:hypothetical protein
VGNTTATTRRTTIQVRRRRRVRSMGRVSVECRANIARASSMVFASLRWRATEDDDSGRLVAVDDDGNEGGRRHTRVHSR